ncbi:MAG: hypothetical protein VX403_10610 [Planctomycetota bacterium]|nr:hypothetical protein [Planctomycetota bacterium]MEC9234348.1 hypothetical protein [Planctomycetota bacterium]
MPRRPNNPPGRVPDSIRGAASRLLFMVGCLLPAVVHGGTRQPDPPVLALETSPPAVIGRPLVVPVRIAPSLLDREVVDRVPILREDGRTEIGLLARLDVVGSASASWSSDRVTYRALPLESSMIPPNGIRGLLLVDLAGAYSGAFQLGDQTIAPRWMEPAPPLVGEVLPAESGPAWPSLEDPTRWWRWALLAESLGAAPPEPVGPVRARLIARYSAAIWRSALQRIALESPGTADELRELLTARCRNETGGLVAAWITDPDELGPMLSLLVDLDRPAALTVRSLLSFLDARFPLLAWPTSSSESRVRIALANPTKAELVVRMQWVEGDPVPVAEVVPPGRIIEFDVDRPDGISTPSDRGSPASNPLVLSCESMDRRLVLPAPSREALPPGLRLGPLLAPLTLSEAWDHREQPPSPSWQTTGVLRKRRGQWELFIECMTDPGADEHDDLLVVHLGPQDAPIRIITLSPEGELDFAPGGGALRGADAMVARYPDRWRASLQLEPSLVASAAAPGLPETLLIGLRRVIDDRCAGSAEIPVPTWSSQTPVTLVDLSGWGDIPPSRIRSTR